MSQLLQPNDGPFDSQLQFLPQDSPTIGRHQVHYSPNNPSPVSETGKRYAESIPFLSRWVICTNQDPNAPGLSARLLPVLYKRAPLLPHLQVVLLQQEVLFLELLSIIPRHLRAHNTVRKSNLVRQRSVWTTYWPPRGASTSPRTHLLSLFHTRITQGNVNVQAWHIQDSSVTIDTTGLFAIRMVLHEASPIQS